MKLLYKQKLTALEDKVESFLSHFTRLKKSRAPARTTDTVQSGRLRQSPALGLLLIFSFIFSQFLSIALLAPKTAYAATIGKPSNYLTLSSGLVGWWTFDGADMVSNVRDRSGYGNDGTKNSNHVPTIGKIGQALKWLNSSDIPLVNNGSLSISDQLTVALWIKHDQYHTGYAYQILKKWSNTDNANYAWYLFGNYLGNGGQGNLTLYANRGGVWGGISGTYRLQEGVWYHAVVSYDSNIGGQLYINGSPVGNRAGSGTLTTNGVIPAINMINGSLDDVRIYNRALTATEIKNLYNSGSAKFSATTRGVAGEGLNRGLVGHWTFDGADMVSNVRDRSGQGNNGNLFGQTSTTTVAGKIGQALKFNGINDYIEVQNHASLNPSNITISAWAKSQTSTWNNYGFLVSKRDVLVMHPSSGSTNVQSYFYIGGTWVAASCTPTTPITDWNLYTMTWDGTSIRCYINGIAGTPATPGGALNTSDTGVLTIGRDDGIARYFNGSLDDVRVYNRALSATEVIQLYNLGGSKLNASPSMNSGQQGLSAGLVGYWTFDGKDMNWNTNKANDRSGQANHGTITNMSTTTSPARGKLGQALKFDGIEDYVATSLNIDAEPVSVAAWVYPTSFSGNRCFWCTDNGGWDKGVEFTGGTWQVHVGNALTDTGVAASLNTWQYSVAVYTASDIFLYVNGVLVWSKGSAPGGDSGASLEIGRAFYSAGAGSRFFEGLVDDVRVYNRSLSTSEVLQLYNLGR